jgi:2-dehydro-3-deoxyphosphogluconate aldolase / (4S)-4-hydroxy-2-oxoglutarate aldolase
MPRNNPEDHTMQRIFQIRVVPVVVIDRAEDAVPLAEALVAGGVNVIEITFRTPAAEQSIRNVRKACPAMLVGAGTILDVGQLQRALDAGAQFGVAPGLNEAVVVKSLASNLPFVPGVMTASEVERGLGLGCKLQKFFPAEPAGGVRMLKALAGPYAHTGVKFIPLGGVNAANARDYLALPIVAAIGGSWMVERTLIAGKNWPTIRTLTAEAVQLAASVGE